MGDSKDDDFSKWAAQMNKSHGYGGIFNAETDQEKAIVETMTAEEWCQAVAAEEGVSFGALRHNENDPPDIFVEFGSWTLGVELVQLIDEDHKRRASSGSRRKTKQSSPQSVDESPYAGALFIDMQWSRDRFDNKLNEIIQKKAERYEKNGQRIDVLVIHTDEPWLDSSQAREWLTEIEIRRPPNIPCAYLLCNYEPGRGVEHWPVFRLFGSLDDFV